MAGIIIKTPARRVAVSPDDAEMNITRNKGCLPHLSPTIFREMAEAYPDCEIRILPGDTYAVDLRGSSVEGDEKIMYVDVVAVKREEG